MSIEKSVLAALQDYNTAMKAGDIERQLAFFSEEWQSSSGGTKADLRASFQTQDLQASNQDKRLSWMMPRWSSTGTRPSSTP